VAASGTTAGSLVKQAHRGLGEKDEENADGAEKSHVPKAGAPDGSFGAFGLLGAEFWPTRVAAALLSPRTEG